MFKIRFAMFMILALSFLPGQLAAQRPNGDDAGQYVILSAQYGHDRRHVDVTNRLKQLASADLVFRASNDVFGVDPDPGVMKTLRIYARGPDGQENMFEYREGSVVDGSQFRGWRGGNWGNGGWSGNWAGGGDRDAGQYVILSAQYGHDRRHVDVTNRLKQLASADLVFRASNDVFGVDPDPGVVKTLRIYARGPDGQENMFEYRENSVVDGSQFRGWRDGNWGNGGWSGNWAGGGDRDRDEHAEDRDGGRYVILSAQYGHRGRHVDVTNRLKDLARAGQTFQAANHTFGVDPDPGVKKTLRIYARGPNGNEEMFEYREGSVVDGSQFRGWRSGNWGGGWSGNWH